MRFRMRYVLLGLLVVVLVFAVPIVYKAVQFSREYSKIVIGDVSLTSVASGVYRGTCDIGPVVAEAEVTVADGAITAIKLVRHINGQGSAAEVITERVVEAQSLRVDTIAGATISSKVILKAIEKALAGD